MSKVCQVTGKKPMFGNNVSHANNKTRRKFNVNLQKKKFWVPEENRYITLRLSMHGLRIINKKGITRVVKEIRARGTKLQFFNNFYKKAPIVFGAFFFVEDLKIRKNKIITNHVVFL